MRFEFQIAVVSANDPGDDRQAETRTGSSGAAIAAGRIKPPERPEGRINQLGWNAWAAVFHDQLKPVVVTL